jgi:demethylmenaquinone methyltransferase/2-methoxy-6-polyprenyl-1,4-benzoquinol methylase
MADESEDASLVPYGYRRVGRREKKRLVLRHFDQIAHRYDLADALLSMGLHFGWRRFVIRSLQLTAESRLLDLCGGTGDFAAMAARRAGGVGVTVVCDMNRPMMDAGRKRAVRHPWGRRIHWVQGDAEELGFPDRSFDALTVGFGIRNLVDLEKGLREIFRVLKARGRLVILEFSVPVSPWLRILYEWYSFKVMPPLGRIITGRSEPFRYLAESVRTFPSPEGVAESIRTAGFRRVSFTRLSDGLVAVYVGEK